MVSPITPAPTPGSQVQSSLPPTVSRLLQASGRALGLGQHQSAERTLARALELAPDNAEIYRLMGIAALMAGDYPKAIDKLQSALIHCPDDAAATMTLGNALVETGATEAGLTHLQRACELSPDDAVAWYNLGVAFESDGNMNQARDALDHAVRIKPEYIKARDKLAYAMMLTGDIAAAVKTLRGTLSRQPDSVNAWSILGNLKTARLGREDILHLQNLLKRPDLPDESRIVFAFTLAKAFEDQAEYTAAFDTVSKANVLKRRQIHWNRDEERKRVDAIAQAFTRPLPEPVDASLGKGILFIVSVPRSGSTLIEHILASHAQVEGGGETGVLPDILNEESDRRGQRFPAWVAAATIGDWHRLGEAYLERTRTLRGGQRHFTDKTIDNWAYVGAAFAMLPAARVVDTRRDPLETCFACYRQLFLGRCHFTYDLDDMVDFYAGYERLSDLWRDYFPQRYTRIQYESLQERTDEQIRRLLDFCELPFDPACVAFHQARRTVNTFSSAQVREPMRKNTARSALYGNKLDPLRAKLRAAGVEIMESTGKGKKDDSSNGRQEE